MNDTSDKQKVKFNRSVNVKYASNPTSLNSSFQDSLSKKSSSNLLKQTKPNLTNQLSINKLSTNSTLNQSKPLKSSNLINQLFKLNANQPKKTSELNKISNHNQVQAKKMRTLTTAVSEKNAEFKSKYGLNKTANQSTSLLNKPAKTKFGTVVDEKVTVSHKGTFDSGPVLASTTVSKNKDHYKLPYGKGENIETNEFGEQIWKHKNLRAYEEKTKRKVRQEFDVPASAVVKRLNESAKLDKLDKNNNEQTNTIKSSSAQKKYMYGMNGSGALTTLSGGGNSELELSKSGNINNNNSQTVVLHSTNYSNNSLNHSPFKDTSKLNSNGVLMIDRAIQCELKKSKSNKEERKFSETGWKHYVEEPEEPRFREFSSDKWYYDKYEFEPGEIIPESRQIDDIGKYHQVNRWTKKINPSSIEQKVEETKKVDTEYKHKLTGSFKGKSDFESINLIHLLIIFFFFINVVIKPDKNGYITTYSSSKPPNKNLGQNSAGQQVISCNKSGEVIYSQVDKSKKRLLRDQLHTPLPGYDSDDEELSLKKHLEEDLKDERPRSASKNPMDKYRLMSSRSPSPVSRSKMIHLNIPSEKQKSKLQNRAASPQPMIDPHLLPLPSRSSSGPRLVRNRVFHFGNTSAEPIEPPPQFATLNHHKLPPKAPGTLSRSASNSHQMRRIPIEADSKWYYQNEQSQLSDQSSVFGLKKNHETLEEAMSFVSSGSEFGIEKEQHRLNNRIADSTIRELDKKKKHISYNNQATRHHSLTETPMANSIWYKSLGEDYRKGMASNEICLPNYTSTTMSKADKKKMSKEDRLALDRQAFTLDKRYLEERKKNASSGDRFNKSSLLSRRPTQQASDFVDKKMQHSSRQFNSTRDLTQTSQLDKQKRSSSLTRYNESESDASIASNNIKVTRSAFRGLNYPLKPVTRSASMQHHPGSTLNHSSLLKKQPSNVIRSTASDHGMRPISRASATSRFSASGQNIIQNDPVVLYLPAVDNSSREMNTLTKTGTSKISKSNSKSATIGSKKSSSVNNLSTVNRSNSILSKLNKVLVPSSKKNNNKSKSTDKLNLSK